MNSITPFSGNDDDGGGLELPTYRTLPHNLEAEQALLAAILVNNEAANKIMGFLRAEHFYEPVHARIYEAACHLIERGQIATPVTLKPFFERDEALAGVGGVQYLARLAASAVTIINAEDYGRTIHDHAIRRELIQIGEDLVNAAYEPTLEESALDQVEQTEQKLFALAQEGNPEGGFQTFAASLTHAIRMVEAAYKKDGLAGVGTGFKDLDDALGGLHPSDLIVLAGRPSMGKTALATNIAFNAARANFESSRSGEGTKKGAVVGFFSLEMSAEQLATRVISEQTNISSDKMRKGYLSNDDFAKVVLTVQDLEQIPLFIDDTPALSIAALRTRARRLKRSNDLGLVVVDYLQLLRPSARSKSENRVQEISEITQGLKALAKELNVPVLALSQLSRAVEQRDDKRPLLADLRESGTIEQDADMVLFIYREEYYLERRQPDSDTEAHEKWLARMEQVHNVAEIIIGKQRHGPTKKIRLFFEGDTTRFGDLDLSEYLPDATR